MGHKCIPPYKLGVSLSFFTVRQTIRASRVAVLLRRLAYYTVGKQCGRESVACERDLYSRVAAVLYAPFISMHRTLLAHFRVP